MIIYIYVYSSLFMEILLYDNMYIVHSLWRYYYMIIDMYSSLSMEILLYDNRYIYSSLSMEILLYDDICI
jgi:hypothetical protein